MLEVEGGAYQQIFAHHLVALHEEHRIRLCVCVFCVESFNTYWTCVEAFYLGAIHILNTERVVLILRTTHTCMCAHTHIATKMNSIRETTH
jgi:hypothetical protein